MIVSARLWLIVLAMLVVLVAALAWNVYLIVAPILRGVPS